MDKWSLFKNLLQARSTSIPEYIQASYNETIKDIWEYAFSVSGNHTNINEIVDIIGGYLNERVSEITPEIERIYLFNGGPTPENCKTIGTAKALSDTLKQYIQYREKEEMLAIQ